MSKSPAFSRRRVVLTLSILAFALWVLVPYYFLVVTSLTPKGEPTFGLTLPKSVTLDAYRSVFSGGGGQPTVWRYMWNSVLIAAGSTVLAFVVSLPAAYGLSRLMPRRSARFVYVGFLALQALPTVALVLAIFLLYSKYGLIDSRPGLMVALLTISVPFEVWILKSYFDVVPREYEESAALDGAGHINILVRVVLPMMGEALAATGVLTFLALYIDFIFAVTLTTHSAVTVPVYILGYQNELATDVNGMSAAAIVSMLPMLGVYLIAQRYMHRIALIGG
jgi:multiple sugar transport system permease protein